MKRNFTLTLFISYCLLSWDLYGQHDIKENSQWVFGYHTLLDFRSGSPVLSESKIEVPAGYATMCDTAGELMFYTNGWEVWDRNHNKMPHATNIFPVVGRLSPYAGPQGALIIPVIGETDKYYLFSIEATSNSPYVFPGKTDTMTSRMWYSVIDMSLNGGLGDMDIQRMSIPLDSGLSGNMIAVQGDACNVWVLVHNINTPVFKAYEINAAGVNPNPVISHSGTLTNVTTPSLKEYNESNMKISPDRRKLALSSRGSGVAGIGLELYDFDPATGVVSNARLIDHRIGAGGLEFSPDNSKLYVAALNYPPVLYALFQYDITLPTTADITASRVVIDSSGKWLDLRLAPDGKIYHISDHPSYATASKQINCINNPNLAGAACNYTMNVVPFPTATNTPQTGQRFPAQNIRVMEVRDPEFVKTMDTLVCNEGLEIHLKAPDGYSQYSWNNGISGNQQTIHAPGVYWVVSSDVCNLRVDTFVVGELQLEPVRIEASGSVLSTTEVYASYQWFRGSDSLRGETSREYTPVENGIYHVVVKDASGCTGESNRYNINNLSVDGNAHADARIEIYPNPSRDMIRILSPEPLNAAIHGLDGKVLLRASARSQVDIGTLPPGVYTISLHNAEGALVHRQKLIRIL